MLLAIIISTLIATSLLLLKTKNNIKDEWLLSVSMQSSVLGHIQIFYDIGNGLNENDSVALPIAKTGDWVEYLFPLPNEPIQYIRIDPLNREGHFALKEIKIVGEKSQSLDSIMVEKVKPLQMVCNVATKNNIFTADTMADADDPVLFLDLEYPLTNKVNLLMLGIYGIVLLICSFIACFVIVCLFVKFLPEIKPLTCPKFFTKKLLVNFLIVVISTGVSIAIGYIVYQYIVQTPEPIVYQGEGSDYALSFYNGNGQKISKQNGKLKLKLDPFTIYANYPNQNSASYSIDSKGFRDTYTRKPAPEQLAVVMGGSAAFGQGLVNSNDTFSSRIGRLNEKYRIMNAGTVGFLSGQELSQMIHVLDPLAPAVYIVFDGWNDIFDPYSYASAFPTSGGPIGFNNTFFMIEQQLAVAFQIQNKQPDNSPPSPVLSAASKTFKDETEYFQAILSTYIANISRMNAFAKARSAKFLMIFQPELSHKKVLSSDEQEVLNQWNTLYKYIDRGIGDRYGQLIHNAKTFCKEQDIVYIDMNEEPRFNENPNTLFYDVVHPNKEGHKIIAELINEIL